MLDTEHELRSIDPTDIFRKLPPEEIHALPLVSCPLEILYIRDKSTARRAADELAHERLLGFDTETRPTFKKGQVHPPALLQLAGTHRAYVFRLYDIGMPSYLRQLMANRGIIKAGVAVGRDVIELQDMKPFDPQGFVDLGTVARENKLQHHGLRGLAALLLHCRISKGARLTNWSRANLSDAAITYAATDAWVGRRLYEIMSTHKELTGLQPV